MKWIDALRQWNNQQPAGHKYIIPKLGTTQYLEIRELMNQLQPAPKLTTIFTEKIVKVEKPKRMKKAKTNTDKVLPIFD